MENIPNLSWFLGWTGRLRLVRGATGNESGKWAFSPDRLAKLENQMSLRFVRDTVYLPDRDAVKTTAIEGDAVISCLATRSALILLGCTHLDGPARMVEKFEHHRPMIESAAAFKLRRGEHRRSGAVCIDGQDLCALFGFQGA